MLLSSIGEYIPKHNRIEQMAKLLFYSCTELSPYDTELLTAVAELEYNGI